MTTSPSSARSPCRGGASVRPPSKPWAAMPSNRKDQPATAVFEGVAERNGSAPAGGLREFCHFMNRMSTFAREAAGQVINDLVKAINYRPGWPRGCRPAKPGPNGATWATSPGWLGRKGEEGCKDPDRHDQTISLITMLDKDDEAGPGQLATCMPQGPGIQARLVEEGLLPHQSSIDEDKIRGRAPLPDVRGHHPRPATSPSATANAARRPRRCAPATPSRFIRAKWGSKASGAATANQPSR